MREGLDEPENECFTVTEEQVHNAVSYERDPVSCANRPGDSDTCMYLKKCLRLVLPLQYFPIISINLGPLHLR